MKPIRWMIVWLLGGGLGQAAGAQESTSPVEVSGTDTGLENVIVTARRYEEKLQDVPVAISAYGTEALELRNIVDMQSLASIAPGLAITQANSPTTLIIILRGLGNTNPNTGADAAVGLYLNEVPINLQNGTNVGMFDLNSVQVLKGPQGTLFGRNTTGGAVLLTANRPTDRLEGYTKAGATFFEEGDGWQGEAVVNVPLGEKLAFRAGVSLIDRDGWVRNILPRDTPAANYGYGPLPYGPTDFTNEMPMDSKAWRASLLWNPTDAIENLTIYDGSDVSSTGLPTYATALNPTGGAITFFSPLLGYPDPQLAYATLNDYKKNKYWWSTMTVGNHPLDLTTSTVSNTTTLQLSGGLKLKNIFGYRDVREEYAQDIVGLGAAYFDYAIRAGGTNWSDELQLQGVAVDDRLNWVAGVFYFEEDRINKSGPFNQFGGPAGSLNSNFSSKSKSYSGFAQASYKFTDSWSATLGARYTQDERDAVLSRLRVDATGTEVACLFPGLTVEDCRLVGNKDFDALTYTASVEYHFDESTLVYLATRKGYRSGGFSATQSAAPTGELQPFDAETVTDVELGFKRDWIFGNDVQLRTNLAIYQQQYEDIQRLAVDPNDFTNQVIINVPKAKVPGGEFEAVLIPVPNLTPELQLRVRRSEIRQLHRRRGRQLRQHVQLRTGGDPHLLRLVRATTRRIPGTHFADRGLFTPKRSIP